MHGRDVTLVSDAEIAIRPNKRNAPSFGAFVLLGPLLIVYVITLAIPIGLLLYRSVQDTELRTVAPETAAMLGHWSPDTAMPEEIVLTFSRELADATSRADISALANRLNNLIPGSRSLLLTTHRKLNSETDAQGVRDVTGLDPRWKNASYWIALRQARGPVTASYLLNSLDLQISKEGGIISVPEDRKLFVSVFVRTLNMSAITTLLSLLVALPIAYLMSQSSPIVRALVLMCVMLPFWTSVLVRVAGWLIILQREGIVNDFMGYAGLGPFDLVHNRIGVYVGMTHLMIPYMVLPIYSVMKSIDPNTVNAALSLGASPLSSFRLVFLPQCWAGIVAGVVLVFVLAVGYYTTPALLGGAADQMISYFIAFYTNQTLNWGMASALSLILLIIVLLCYSLLHLLGGRQVSWR